MSMRRFLTAFLVLVTLLASACLADRVVGPEEPIPALLAIDRPMVQLFRFARGRSVVADTVRITNNGEGQLGLVDQIGGVDYITTARTGWLDASVVNQGTNGALLILRPTYAEDEQEAADVAEVVLGAEGSPGLKTVTVIARTLRGASFEFSVSPLAFAAAPDDDASSQAITVRNGGNGTLEIRPPTVRFEGAADGWLTVTSLGGSNTAPDFRVEADPGPLGGGLFRAFLDFESLPSEETRAKPASLEVLLNIGQPQLGVSTTTQAFTVIRGAENPPRQTVMLSNVGAGAFGSLGTLQIGTVAYGPGATDWIETDLSGNQLQVGVLTQGLPAGEYTASFSVESVNGGAETIQTVLSVEAPIFTPSTSTVSFGIVAGDAVLPEPAIVEITNTGSGDVPSLGDITLGAFAPAAPWITSSIHEEEIILTPTAIASTLGVGTYNTTLSVQTAFGGNASIAITLSVSPDQDQASIALSATALEFTGVRGDPNPPQQTVQISNSGGGALGALSLGPISYTGPSGWLISSLADSTVTLSVVVGTLPTGSHIATVPVVSVSGGTDSIQVTLNVGSPVLTGSATSASFSAMEGGGNPPPTTINFSNTGPGTFSTLGIVSAGAVTYTGTGGWLTASYAAGVLTLSVNSGALAAGTYGASVPVTSANGGSVTVDVSFTVIRNTDAALLVASPATVRLDAIRGGSNPPDQTVLLSNGGGGTLGALGVGTISYGSGSGWLSASLVGSTVTLSASTGTLAADSYDATVALTSANGGNQSVAVNFVVAAPTLTLSASSASFGGEEGGSISPASVAIDLSNTGTGDFSDLGAISLGTTVYGSGAGWVTSSLGGGNTRVDLSVAFGALGPGTHTATVPVNSAAGGSKSIAVTFTVSPAPADPTLVLSSTSATFFAQEGSGNPAPQNITISNEGGGGIGALGALTLGATVYGSGSGWLNASLVGTTLTLSPVTGSLVAGGPYTATVPVQSVNGGNQSISVTFNVTVAGGAADLEVSPATVRMDAVEGGSNPGDLEVLLNNGGGSPLGGLSVVGITYGSGSGWLSESLVGSTLTLSGDVSGLSAGTYTASVEVASVNGGNETVAVTLEVSGPVLTLSSTSASFAGPEGGAASPGSVSIGVSNTGAGVFASLGSVTLGPTTYGSAGGWLTASQAGGGTQVDLSATLGALGDGVYTATLPVNSTAGGSASINVTFTVSRGSDQPTLSLSASAVEFTAVFGGNSPSAKTVNISNSGGGTVSDLGTLGIGTITYGGGSSGWLSTSSLAGSTLTLSPVTGALPTGTHTATFPVQSQFGGDKSVTVTLEVGRPVLTASTLGLSFTGLEGGTNPPAQPVTFSNTGAGDLSNLGTVSVGTVGYTGVGGWLSGPPSGTTVVGGSQTFSVNQGSLPAGSYTATVPVSSQHGGTVTVAVALSVVRETDDPILVLSANTQRFDALLGGGDPGPKSVLVSNGGGGDLGNIQAGPTSYGPGATGWLNHALSGQTLTVSVATAGLGKGTYTATLPVSSAAGGTRSLAVTLVVGSPRLTVAPRALSFSDSVGGTGPDPLTVTIANTGGGTFASLGPVEVETISYGMGAADWLEVTRPTTETLSVRAITGPLPPQATPYDALVPVISSLGEADTVAVSFSVTTGGIPPDLSLSVDSITFSGVLGGGPPPPQIVSGQNSGGGLVGDLTVAQILYLDQAQDWLSGSVSGSLITLQATVAGVPSGTNRARVIVESLHGGADTLVAVLGLAQPVLSLSSRAITFSDTVGSPTTLQSQVFISNSGIGAGDRSNLGLLELGDIVYPQGESGWLQTIPPPGTPIGTGGLTLGAVAAGLSEGTSLAWVPVQSEWGGTDTVAVTLVTRIPDRSFDLPTIEFVTAGNTLPGDSVVVGITAGDTAQVGVRVGVRNASDTRVTLSGLRVDIPTYPPGQPTGWITGAFLDRTSVTFSEPAELFVAINPGGLSPGRYEARLVVSSQSAGLEAVAPRVLRVILKVE